MHDFGTWFQNGALIAILGVILNINGRFRIMESHVGDLWDDFIARKKNNFSCPYEEGEGND